MRRHFRKQKRSLRPQDIAMTDILSAQTVASLPPPGLSGPSQPVWSPDSSRYLAYISSSVHSVRHVASPPALYKPLVESGATLAPNNSGTSSIYPSPSITTATTTERALLVIDMQDSKLETRPLLRFNEKSSHCTNKRSLESPHSDESLEEKLRRERQRLSSGSSLTQFDWVWVADPLNKESQKFLRLLIPARGCLYIQDGVSGNAYARCIHDKTLTGNLGAVDPQLSPDGSLVAWTADGEVYCKSATALPADPATRLTYGAVKSATVCISHGVADFVAQEEMDRYNGLWWSPRSDGVLFARVDESMVPIFRIVHYPSQQTSPSDAPVQFEDHRYPFAGKLNPVVRLGYVTLDKTTMQQKLDHVDIIPAHERDSFSSNFISSGGVSAEEVAARQWDSVRWFDAPQEANEYLARVHWLPDGRTVITQWQNRTQDVSVLYRMNVYTGEGHTLLVERSNLWINLHNMFYLLPRVIHPNECSDLDAPVPQIICPITEDSFSFLFASEKTGYSHLYLYTFFPGVNDNQAILLKAITAGSWVVEQIVGVDVEKDTVYVTGTYDSPLERHLYAVPLTGVLDRCNSDGDVKGGEMMVDDYSEVNSPTGVRNSISMVMNALGGKSRSLSTRGRNDMNLKEPTRLTPASGMHSIVMDSNCRFFVDTNSDLDRPPSTILYGIKRGGEDLTRTSPGDVRIVKVLFDAAKDDNRSLTPLSSNCVKVPAAMTEILQGPEILSFPSADGSVSLYAALYRPDARVHGPGPYPLICAVYGGPHVQRVNRCWNQSADMRAQRLRNLGFCVVKCDNRGSSRRGLAFESAIAKNLGRLEVLDQIAAVQQLVVMGIADQSRIGVYGWSYGGYLATMCLFRAPDIFQVAVAGAPVTSWDGYDTHYTERYMGLPSDNPEGYRESAAFDHVPNMRGKLMIVHGLIDENVHFRHSSRLINKLTNAGKEYELLVFPDERHSPRRLRDRVYMEQRISDFFVRHLTQASQNAGGAQRSSFPRNRIGRL